MSKDNNDDNMREWRETMREKYEAKLKKEETFKKASNTIFPGAFPGVGTLENQSFEEMKKILFRKEFLNSPYCSGVQEDNSDGGGNNSHILGDHDNPDN